MKLNTTILEMTDAYVHQSFYQSKENINIIDCRDIEGTRCYLDDDAKAQLLERIDGHSVDGIHFIDSGNYHYLSLLWLGKIKQDFNLVLFDHHPDDQPPSFGMITSCGGWVLEAKETLPHMKNVYTFGVGEVPSLQDIPTDIPLYISIDKDVLSKDYAITDWDQGDMTLPEMLDILTSLFESHDVIGVDICGESGEMAESAGEINNQTNATIFDFLSKNN